MSNSNVSNLFDAENRLILPAWVCYVYQNRYVTFRNCSDTRYLQLYDFDPLRVRKELSDRKNSQSPVTSVALPRGAPGAPRGSRSFLERLREPAPSTPLKEHEGKGADGVQLVMSDVVHKNRRVFVKTVTTGGALPYLLAERLCTADTVLLDGERIVTLDVSALSWSAWVWLICTDGRTPG
jgi:hypothetical protein